MDRMPNYATLTDRERAQVDGAFAEMMAGLRRRGVAVLMDDGADRCLDAVARLVREASHAGTC